MVKSVTDCECHCKFLVMVSKINSNGHDQYICHRYHHHLPGFLYSVLDFLLFVAFNTIHLIFTKLYEYTTYNLHAESVNNYSQRVNMLYMLLFLAHQWCHFCECVLLHHAYVILCPLWYREVAWKAYRSTLLPCMLRIESTLNTHIQLYMAIYQHVHSTMAHIYNYFIT